MRTPPGTSGQWPQPGLAGESYTGTLEFNSGNVAASTVAPEPTSRLCSFTAAKPVPAVVQIAVQRLAGVSPGGANQLTTYDFAAGTNLAYDNLGMGVLLIEYGSGSIRQRAACDLRNGSYQLPPVDYVRCNAVCWFTAAEAPTFAPNVRVIGSINAGQHFGASRPTHTSRVELGAATPQQIPIPDLAREVDFWVNVTDFVAGNPTVALYENAVDGAPVLTKSYKTGVQSPPYRAPVLAGGRPTGGTIRSDIACDVFVQWTLEL
jgi:hypothetical protein